MEIKKENRTLTLALLAINTALVTVLTMLISIPIPATQGYLNFGDVGVLFAGLLLGPLGGLAGGLGSALADFFLGYYHYVPITLVVKGFEGTITGTLFHYLRKNTGNNVALILALLMGSITMVAGYWAAEAMIYGPIAALAEVPGNCLQVIVGSIISAIALAAIQHLSIPQMRPNA
jgi:uncharacterized membrane protein